MSSHRQFILPDLLAMCPFEAHFNPHYTRASPECTAWAKSFNTIPERVIEHICADLLTAHSYPYVSYERFRTCCDFISIMFVEDEITNIQDKDGALQTGYALFNALRDANWDDGSQLAKMGKSFRGRLFQVAGPATCRRIFTFFEQYIIATAEEAEYRKIGCILDLASYQTMRRETGGVRIAIALIGYALDIDLPDEVFEHPIFVDMCFAAVDMVCWSNDLYSYRKEESMGHKANVNTVLMKEKNIDLQCAVDDVAAFSTLVDEFLAGKAHLPSWGAEVDISVANYVGAIESWVVGALHWSLEIPRYFEDERNFVNTR